jgi:hypothetical protein
MTVSAQAQMKMEPKKDNPVTESPEQKKAAERAFQKAQQVIPNSTAKQDPWKGAR